MLLQSRLSFDVTRSSRTCSDCSSGSRNSTSTPKLSFAPCRAAASTALTCAAFMRGKRGLTTWATFSVTVSRYGRGSGSVARCAHDEPARSSAAATTDPARRLRRILFRLEADVLHQLRPAHALLLQELRELLGAPGPFVDRAQLKQAIQDLGTCEDRVHVGVDLAHDGLGRAGGRDQGEPANVLEARVALGHGRDALQSGDARARGD